MNTTSDPNQYQEDWLSSALTGTESEQAAQLAAIDRQLTLDVKIAGIQQSVSGPAQIEALQALADAEGLELSDMFDDNVDLSKEGDPTGLKAKAMESEEAFYSAADSANAAIIAGKAPTPEQLKAVKLAKNNTFSDADELNEALVTDMFEFVDDTAA